MRHLDPEDQRDQAIAEAARRHAAAIDTNISAGHEQTLASMADDFAHLLGKPGVSESLIRAARSVGNLGAGQMVNDLIQRCIDADAENEATKEIERAEAGLSSKDREQMNTMQVRREVSAAYGGGVAA